MKKLKNFIKDFTRNEDAQGATEYILLLVAVVAVLVIFREKIMSLLKGKLNVLEGQMGQFGKD